MSLRSTSSSTYKKLFSLSDQEELVKELTCSYIYNDVFLHGRLYITDNNICFYSDITCIIKCIIIKNNDIKRINKSITSNIINGITIVSIHNEVFSSNTFSNITNIDETLILLNSLIKPKNSSIKSQSSSGISTPASTSLTNLFTNPSNIKTPLARKPRPISFASPVVKTPTTNLSIQTDILFSDTKSLSKASSPEPSLIRTPKLLNVELSYPSYYNISGQNSKSIYKLPNNEFHPYFNLDPSLPYTVPSKEILESDYELVLEAEMNGVTPLVLYHFCYSNNSIFSEYEFRKSIGDYDVKASEWIEKSSDKLMTRNLVFRTPIKDSPIGPSTTRINTSSYLQWFSDISTSSHYSENSPNLNIVDGFCTVDAPYGDYYTMNDHYQFKLISSYPPVTKIKICYALRFLKYTWFKPMIISRSKAGFASGAQSWLKGLKINLENNQSYVKFLLSSRNEILEFSPDIATKLSACDIDNFDISSLPSSSPRDSEYNTEEFDIDESTNLHTPLSGGTRKTRISSRRIRSTEPSKSVYESATTRRTSKLLNGSQNELLSDIGKEKKEEIGAIALIRPVGNVAWDLASGVFGVTKYVTVTLAETVYETAATVTSTAANVGYAVGTTGYAVGSSLFKEKDKPLPPARSRNVVNKFSVLNIDNS